MKDFRDRGPREFQTLGSALAHARHITRTHPNQWSGPGQEQLPALCGGLFTRASLAQWERGAKKIPAPALAAIAGIAGVVFDGIGRGVEVPHRHSRTL